MGREDWGGNLGTEDILKNQTGCGIPATVERPTRKGAAQFSPPARFCAKGAAPLGCACVCESARGCISIEIE